MYSLDVLLSLFGTSLFSMSSSNCCFLTRIQISQEAGQAFCMLKMVTSESESEVAQSCPTLWDPVDCSPPGSSVHGILQARMMEWIAISFSSA